MTGCGQLIMILLIGMIIDFHSNAVYTGKLEVMKWGFNRGFTFNGSYSAPYHSPAERAAANGNDDIVKWLFEVHCPFDERVMEMLARKNNMELVYWAHEHQLPFDEDLCITCADNWKFGAFEVAPSKKLSME